MSWKLYALIGVAALATGSACAKHNQAVRGPYVVPVAPAANPQPLSPVQESAVSDAQVETGATGLHIDDEILRLCPEVNPPRFDFDSSKVKTQFRDTMVDLARCMNNGPMRGRSVLLVGHADPRGEEDYNLSLGGRRAEAVRNALTSLGVQEVRVDVSSRGALDATGRNETTWAQDRRVDIRLKI
jgi:peptidoglycan-associated lipoprotein